MTLRSTTLYASLFLGLLSGGSLLAACSDDDTNPTSSGSQTSTSTSTGDGGGGTGQGGGGDGGTGQGGNGGTGQGGNGGASAGASFVKELDPMKGELPEGLLIDGTTAYVGIAPTGKVVKISLPDGGVTNFGAIATFPMMGANALGLARDKAGAIYVGASGDGVTFQPGIYKIAAAGGNAFLFAQNMNMKFPNGLVFDANGDLFVTDSMSGTIFKIASNGLNVAEWKKDALLAGDVASACATGLGFPLGANGLALSNGVFYVTNTDKASIIKIPVNADGTAGAAEVLAGPDCATLKGPDGVTVDEDGSLIVAANSQNTILRVGMDGKSTVLTSGSPLQFPASVAIATVAGARSVFITNAAFVGMPQTPGLLSFPLDK